MRGSYLLILVGACVLVLNGPTSAAEPEAKKESRKVDKPKYRVLFNYDSGPVFEGKGTVIRAHIEQMVDEIAGGGADVLMVCACDQLATYPSKVWQTHWDGYKEGDLSFFGKIPETQIPRRNDWIGNMADFAKEGDYLKIALARCRERGIAPGVTVRMNDMHDAPWPSSHLFSRFYKEHPELHLKPLAGRSWGAAALDYAHEEVRQHYLKIIRELAEDYDVEVMELDFLRFPYHFDQDDTDRYCELMTEFIRDVRKILDDTGRHITLIPRVASNPGAARLLGFDVQAWARDGLVDGITTGNFLSTCWDLGIEDFRKLVGPDIAIYAASEVSADRRDGIPVRYLPESYEMLRGFAAGNLAAGADGINTFNYFLARRHKPVTAEVFYGGLREMKSLETSRNKPRIHLLTAGFRLTECDIPEQVPVLIRGWRERKFEMLLAAESKGAEVTALVCFDGENGPEDMWLRIGPQSAGHATEIREGPAGDEKDKTSRKSKIAVFKIPPDTIKDGKNDLIIRTGKVETTILGIDVHVGGS